VFEDQVPKIDACMANTSTISSYKGGFGYQMALEDKGGLEVRKGKQFDIFVFKKRDGESKFRIHPEEGNADAFPESYYESKEIPRHWIPKSIEAQRIHHMKMSHPFCDRVTASQPMNNLSNPIIS
jgi:hypothetical protein